MKILDIRETSVALNLSMRNAVFDFSEMTTSVVAVITDQVRDGQPVVGYAFNSTGRYACGEVMRKRMIPRLLQADPDSLLDPTKGFRLTALAEPEGSLRGSFTPYARLRLDGSAYYQVARNIILAGRLRVASIQGAALDDIAPSRRLYAGGGGSVRGFGFQQLGPRDINNDPTGARSLNEAAFEVRYRFGDYGVVGFLDLGQAYASATPSFSRLRAGVGLGGRIYTNFGPMRIDVATPLHRRAGGIDRRHRIGRFRGGHSYCSRYLRTM